MYLFDAIHVMEVRRMRPKPKISPLDKKILPNPRYQGVEHVVNTGSNLRTQLEKLDEIHHFYKFRNDEIFRRITVNNLVSLMVEVGKLEYQLKPDLDLSQTIPNVSCSNEDSSDEGMEDQVDEDIKALIRSQFEEGVAKSSSSRRGTAGVKSSSRRGTARSMTSVITGVGELDSSSISQDPLTPARPFLILDVREQDLFSRDHISLAVNYPAIRLNRAFDYETKDMLRLKNKSSAIIVVYDDDETIANKCASTLTQRGYENVFLLSGGLRVAAIKYPESLVTNRELNRIEEGDIIVLEKLLEENIVNGSSRLSGSRVGSRRSSGSVRSISLDRAGPAHRNKMVFDAPMRTSTALGKKQNRFV